MPWPTIQTNVHSLRAIRPHSYAQSHTPKDICPKTYAQRHMPKAYAQIYAQSDTPGGTRKAYAQRYKPKTTCPKLHYPIHTKFMSTLFEVLFKSNISLSLV